MNYFIQQGMPKEKITMGLATYGRTFQLVNSSNTGIGAASSEAGEPGRFTREAGFLSYYEVRSNEFFDLSYLHFRSARN